MRTLSLSVLSCILFAPAFADVIEISPQTIPEWKSVYGQLETRNRVPARARIGGTVALLAIAEGDSVQAGQRLANIEDNKLSFQVDARNPRLQALEASLATARS